MAPAPLPPPRRGRPISAPGPIGALARVLGGMQALATALGCSRRALLKAAKEGRGMEGKAGARLLWYFKHYEIDPPPIPPVSRREAARIELRTKVYIMSTKDFPPPIPTDIDPTRPKRGRPISTPGPIGQVARALGGMHKLARLLSYSRQALHKAACEGRWIRDPEGERLKAFCNQNGIPFSRS